MSDSSDSSVLSEKEATARRRFWKSSLRVVGGLTALWFLFGCVLSIFAVEPLNRVHIGGFPLGFWMAQQGSTVAFIFIIFAYVILMKRLDTRFFEDMGDARPRRPDGGANH